MFNLIKKTLGQIKIRPSLIFAFIIGIFCSFFLPKYFSHLTKALLTWDIAAGFYVLLALTMMFRTSLKQMQTRARLEDEGAITILTLTIFAALASLTAILFGLSGIENRTSLDRTLHIILVIMTYVISWLLVHVTFALHYAHEYHLVKKQTRKSVLIFPKEEKLFYSDFLYFSFVIAMTSQTADVGLASNNIRRLVTAQGIIAFIFNTTLLAMAINIAAGLIK